MRFRPSPLAPLSVLLFGVAHAPFAMSAETSTPASAPAPTPPSAARAKTSPQAPASPTFPRVSHAPASTPPSAAQIRTSSPSSAGGAATTPPSTLVRAPASGGQPELALGFDGAGRLRAAVCNTPGCSVDSGTELALPTALAADRGKARLSVVSLGERRHALHVSIAGDRPTQAWQAVVVAKPGSSSPDVVFQGMTGYVEGEEGLRRGPSVELSEPIDESGTRRILIGEVHEDLTLCGRPAVLAPKLLAPKDLVLRPAKVQRLSVEERERAARLVAVPRAASTVVAATDQPSTTAGTTPEAASSAAKAPTSGGQASLLRAIGATSAIGWPASLTDGNPETTWAENRGGAGRGEFVSFHAPSDVPLQSFEFVIRPEKREIKHGVGPEKLWLVTDKLVYSVAFPTDPWKAPGVTWSVALPAPVLTSCVAVVTESAFGEKPDSEVTLAEIQARSEFTTASIENLIGALAGGGARADAAGTVLAGLGSEATTAVAQAFDGLDEGGRRVALDVLDHAACADSSPIYVKALLGRVEAHRLHALDRLRRCGPAATDAIEAAIASLPTAKLRPLAELLAEVAPDKALRLLVPRLTGSQKTRRMLREVIAQAARSPKSKEVIVELLARTDLPTEASVDLLRALGRQLPEYEAGAIASIQRLLLPNADFRTKYLLMVPAHLLADKQPALAQQLSALMRSDPSAPLRAEAVRATVHLDRFATDVYAALEDPEVRVRQAAAQTLANYKKAETVTLLGKRLKGDSWPLVRVAAAESLASQSPSDSADRALIGALDDDSWQVKSAAAEAIGARRAVIAGEPLLDRFTDRKERYEVRVAAARALGDICYDRALDDLTDAAKKLRSPSPDPQDRAVAAGALGALARLHPRDLASRLEPLLGGKDTPMGTKEAARAALSTEPHCQMTSALKTASAGERR